MNQKPEIRPRVHAVNIIMIDCKDARGRYLSEQVPPHLQEFVKTHVRLWWPRRELIRAELK